jgi:hypothetical protein
MLWIEICAPFFFAKKLRMLSFAGFFLLVCVWCSLLADMHFNDCGETFLVRLEALPFFKYARPITGLTCD